MPNRYDGATGRLRLTLLCVGLLCLALLPTATNAQDTAGVAPGAGARIAFTNGDGVLLRENPGYDAGVIVVLPEGTAVDVINGPLTADDGSTWYGAAAWGESGYIDAAFLAPLVDAQPVPLPDPPAPDAVASPESADASSAAGATLYVTSDVNLRTAPDATAEIATVVPAGAAVTTAGEGGEFVPVTYNGLAGWIASAFLSGEPVAADTPAPELPPVTGATPAVTTSDVNLRAGPSINDAVLTVVPAGAAVAATGEAGNGYLRVAYEGLSGWVDAAYVGDEVAPAPEPAAAAPEPIPSPGETNPESPTATTTDTVNLRSGPGPGEPVVDVIPSGASVRTTGQGQSGFAPVIYDGQAGWIDDAFLQTGAAPLPEFPDDNAAGAEPIDVAPTGGGIIWPVSGGDWYISQGYNGSSHQNQSSLWQYYYSFDLALRNGSTAGATVISPVNGTVRWLDPSTGGMSIDIGNGHAVAFFHVTIDGGFEAGDPIRQGQYVGTISGPGGPGFAGFPHIHLTLWQTSVGGNWSRVAAPFVGPYAISGQEFPPDGTGNQYRDLSIGA